ncbi:hypothetical protein [Perlucidibaca piscinae]|uniref:hypothetical protein n=1 Tax=Perlucidibaca piscinae TaxID=392589 RepID=UPI0003B30A4C|nr:hypothetical protein [Perlucidibaca piscinae]
MSTFVIVLVLVLGVIIGNLLWLRPSPRERALEAQRQQAKQAGFSVALRHAPEWLQLPIGERMVGHYQIILPMATARLGRWRWHGGLGNWQPVGKPEAWLAPMPWPTPAPAGWLGVEASINGATVYWREDGNPASVPAMLAILRELPA